MATVDEILANMTEVEVASATDEILVIDANTRQISVPGSELIFGVITDAAAERKYFLAPRYVGNNIDLSACFIRVSYRNANGEMDSHLIDDVVITEDGQNIAFSWELHPKVTQYKGQVSFIVCAAQVGEKVNKWNTTLTTGIVLDGLEPTNVDIPDATSDVIAQLLAMVEKQTATVEAEGAAQVKVVQTAAETAEAAAVAQIEAKGVNVRESIPDDYTALSEAVDGLARSRAGAIVCEAAGTAVAVNDASDMKMQGLRIFGRSTQDGVPSPDAPVEIVSAENPVVMVAGKNLLPKIKSVNYAGITVTANEDGTALVNGTAEQQFTLSIGGRLPNIYGGYILSGTPVGSGKSDYCLTVGYFTDSGWLSEAYDTGAGVVIKGADYAPYIGFSLLVRQGITVNNALFKPMLSNNGVEYEPYKDFQTVELTHILPGIPVTSGGNYTDSDGQQWICDEVDLERGVYVQRTRLVCLTDTSKIMKNDESDIENWMYYYVTENKEMDSNITALCNRLTTNTILAPYGSVGFRNSSGIHSVIYLNFSSYMAENTIEALSDALSRYPLSFLFALREPTETPLSETEIAAYRALHSNYPNTTILNDAGAHMAVAYAADTKLYIDNKIAALIGG